MKLTISRDNAKVLALYVKRVTYDDAYRRTDCGDTEEKRKAMAYRILVALSEVEKGLEKEGFSPR